MGLYEAGPAITFHRRVTADMALPPDGTIFQLADISSLPTTVEDGVPNSPFLCVGGHLALLVPSSTAYAVPVQEDP